MLDFAVVTWRKWEHFIFGCYLLHDHIVPSSHTPLWSGLSSHNQHLSSSIFTAITTSPRVSTRFLFSKWQGVLHVCLAEVALRFCTCACGEPHKGSALCELLYGWTWHSSSVVCVVAVGVYLDVGAWLACCTGSKCRRVIGNLYVTQ